MDSPYCSCKLTRVRDRRRFCIQSGVRNGVVSLEKGMDAAVFEQVGDRTQGPRESFMPLGSLMSFLP